LRSNIYLQATPLKEAMAKWLEYLEHEGILKHLQSETVDVCESLGRITAEPVYAKISSPFYHASAMDGYAVRHFDTFEASETFPKKLKLKNQAVYVDTGDPLPGGFNAVVMIENVNLIELDNEEYIEIIEPLAPWQNVRVIGEDILSNELILTENIKIRPFEIGAILASGHTKVNVRKKPLIAIIPTGTEIVEPGTHLKTGDIIEFNSRVLSGFISEWGGIPVRFNIVSDKLKEIKNVILKASENSDMVVINAGASSGSEDFTAEAIKEIGEIIFHGVDIKPGKPVMLGLVNGKPVLGIPGYPVSAYITFNLFAKPVIQKWLAYSFGEEEIINAKLARNVSSTLGQEEFIRVKVGKTGKDFTAIPIARGAGALMSLVRADGFLKIPAMSEGIAADSEVKIELLRPKKEIENAIVCIGSHDNILDLLASCLKKTGSEFSLSSAHVGSMAGLISLKKNESHIAGVHLLDEQTGEYNIPFIKKILPDKKIILVNISYRDQGLVVLKSNPKNIMGFKDLLRKDIAFINRQNGSGTRLLFDKNLKELSINPENINGYEREEFTHMGVASAVLSGIADTGLAIYSAAKALGLGFIYVAKERYDLAIPAEFYDMDMVQALLKIIREDKEFRDTVIKLGGYDVTEMGKVLYKG
jgi:putative molybdopterin biosynthesis protein